MSRVLPLISTIDLWRTYQLGSEEINALRGVNMTVMPGQFIAVVGRSGSGKTTLLNILAGLDKPTSGQVLFENRDIAAMNEHDLTEIRRHKIGFVFQSFGLLPLLSAFENVELPLRIAGVRTREREERTREALDIVGLWGRAKHRPYELSGGEQQRVAIARALVLKPKFIVLDEPTSALDMSVQAQIVELLRELQTKHNLAYLFISHDLKVVRALAHEMLVLHDGKVVEQGLAEDVIVNPKEPYTRALMAAAFELKADEAGVVRT